MFIVIIIYYSNYFLIQKGFAFSDKNGPGFYGIQFKFLLFKTIHCNHFKRYYFFQLLHFSSEAFITRIKTLKQIRFRALSLHLWCDVLCVSSLSKKTECRPSSAKEDHIYVSEFWHSEKFPWLMFKWAWT